MNCAAPHDRPVTAARGQLCAGHESQLVMLLEQIPAVVAWLGGNLQRQQGRGERVSGSRTAPAPLRIEVVDHVELICAQISSWSGLLAEERGLAGPSGKRGVNGQVGFLLAHIDWIAGRSWSVDLIAELWDAVGVAQRIAPWKAARHHLPMPCPRCDSLTLTRWDGDELVRCARRIGGCGSSWTSSDYDRMLTVMAGREIRGDRDG